MDWEVIEARVVAPGLLTVRFADGLEGQVRFEPTAYRGVFAPLGDPEFFARMYVDGWFVTWPGEIDLAPDAMYHEIKATGECLLRGETPG